MSSPGCENFEEICAMVIAGAATPEEMEQLDIHLDKGCAECNKAIADLQGISVSLTEILDPEDPPADVRTRLLDAVHQEFELHPGKKQAKEETIRDRTITESTDIPAGSPEIIRISENAWMWKFGWVAALILLGLVFWNRFDHLKKINVLKGRKDQMENELATFQRESLTIKDNLVREYEGKIKAEKDRFQKVKEKIDLFGKQNFEIREQLSQTRAKLKQNENEILLAKAIREKLNKDLLEQNTLLEGYKKIGEKLGEALKKNILALQLLKWSGTQIVVIKGLKAGEKAFGRVFWNPKNNRGLLTIHGLPPLPNDKEYQLWAIQEKTDPVDAGNFNTEAGGEGLLKMKKLPKPQIKIDVFAITIEPAGGSPKPTTKVFLLGKNKL